MITKTRIEWMTLGFVLLISRVQASGYTFSPVDNCEYYDVTSADVKTIKVTKGQLKYRYKAITLPGVNKIKVNEVTGVNGDIQRTYVFLKTKGNTFQKLHEREGPNPKQIWTCIYTSKDSGATPGRKISVRFPRDWTVEAWEKAAYGKIRTTTPKTPKGYKSSASLWNSLGTNGAGTGTGKCATHLRSATNNHAMNRPVVGQTQGRKLPKLSPATKRLLPLNKGDIVWAKHDDEWVKGTISYVDREEKMWDMTVCRIKPDGEGNEFGCFLIDDQVRHYNKSDKPKSVRRRRLCDRLSRAEARF